ncbi:hypothetical protein, partial [Microvirga tunisiensis]|uniref:hypothetical protein n=1 Tax=Microvirga tunisiensis TaxID=2108360 RepID=UPI001AEDD991
MKGIAKRLSDLTQPACAGSQGKFFGELLNCNKRKAPAFRPGLRDRSIRSSLLVAIAHEREEELEHVDEVQVE